MTRRSSGIHAAWHFWHAAIFCGESGLREVSLCGIHPLTRRYNAFEYATYQGLKWKNIGIPWCLSCRYQTFLTL
ncbi:DUF3265 domain-containing protein [Vibrio vulnificus]|nr:DUF3265 domain-containing protein [Vibrio vulnificus]EGQ9330087.1 DUF3265 domain-containing protein [Vibrio vulnificus]EGQ9784826.1 DUF3265 domain-containing protein [Vibrio vulnificus]EGR0089286.1 DUF3265 domain-containing protein [Vibrio vulnificus]EGR0106888.1 DUF3265 domain-containing protein [Vibrio vulnificus]